MRSRKSHKFVNGVAYNYCECCNELVRNKAMCDSCDQIITQEEERIKAKILKHNRKCSICHVKLPITHYFQCSDCSNTSKYGLNVLTTGSLAA